MKQTAPRSLKPRTSSRPAPTQVEAILEKAYRAHRWDRYSREAWRANGKAR